jgi:histidinol-phosphate aminotransferase
MTLIRPLVERLHAYVPGEQPKIAGLIKLNTNENPYPPSPVVLDAIKAAVDGRMRLYPNPTSLKLREKLAQLHGCATENILVGNGSDELLALATRCFTEPWIKSSAAKNGPAKSRCTIQYPWPCYSLYPVLAQIHGARINSVPLKPDFALPTPAELKQGGKWDFRAALTIITTPNAPTGRGYANAELEALCQHQKGVVILDEAYVDFAVQNAMDLALKHPHVLVARTFSKAYALCFQRVGYFVGPPRLIQALEKIKDSYNVNGLGQIAAEATLDDLGYYRDNFKRILHTREKLTNDLTGLGFEVSPSQTNFIFVRPPKLPAKDWLEALRTRKILVRWFKDPAVSDYLRITVGTDAEAALLVKASKAILK